MTLTLRDWLLEVVPGAAVCLLAGDELAQVSSVVEAGSFTLPEELGRAVARRRKDFLVGRYCARQALATLGFPDAEVGFNADRSPAWPAGVVGSISHTSGIVVAMVAPGSEVFGLGIDAEVFMPTSHAVAIGPQIAEGRELEQLHAACSRLEWAKLVTLVFSAKEAIYKCLYPRISRYFGFEAARIEAVDVAAGTFQARLVEDLSSEVPAGLLLSGAFRMTGSLVLTSVILRRV